MDHPYLRDHALGQPTNFEDVIAEARRIADEVLTLARAGIPFSDARSMDEVERRAYLAALAAPSPSAPVERPARRDAEPETTGLSFIS